jgi:hypothetical protein
MRLGEGSVAESSCIAEAESSARIPSVCRGERLLCLCGERLFPYYDKIQSLTKAGADI